MIKNPRFLNFFEYHLECGGADELFNFHLRHFRAPYVHTYIFQLSPVELSVPDLIVRSYV